MSEKLRYQGRAFIRIDGREYPTLEGANFTPGGEVRDPVTGQRVYGYRTTVSHAEITCTIPRKEEISLFDVKNITSATIEFQADSGGVFLMAEAWCDGRCSLTAAGDISATFQAIEAREL